jgi:hypothetical protein
MGYAFDGGRMLSDLAHGHRSGDLARAIRHESRDEVQIAYSCGWFTHVLADQAIHPLINRAAGEWRGGAGATPLTAKDDLLAHVRIEMGLDGYVGRRHTSGPDPRSLHPFDAHRLDFLSRAYRLTFGIHLSPSMMDRGPGRLRRLSPLLLAWCRLRGERSPVSRRSPSSGPETTRRNVGVTGLQLAHGLLNPIPPSVWLIRTMLREVTGFLRFIWNMPAMIF